MFVAATAVGERVEERLEMLTPAGERKESLTSMVIKSFFHIAQKHWGLHYYYPLLYSSVTFEVLSLVHNLQFVTSGSNGHLTSTWNQIKLAKTIQHCALCFWGLHFHTIATFNQIKQHGQTQVCYRNKTNVLLNSLDSLRNMLVHLLRVRWEDFFLISILQIGSCHQQLACQAQHTKKW